MDIFKFAKKMEKDGEKFYRKLATKAVQPGIKRILGILADAEVRHYEVLAAMEKEQRVKLGEAKVLSKAKNIFSGMKLKQFDPGFAYPQIDAYKKALEIEKKSRDFYVKKAKEVKNESQRALFLRIAEEEKQHYFLVDNIIEFMQKPFRWLENAEWHHFEEY